MYHQKLCNPVKVLVAIVSVCQWYKDEILAEAPKSFLLRSRMMTARDNKLQFRTPGQTLGNHANIFLMSQTFAGHTASASASTILLPHYSIQWP
jgi:hypothetical protein